MSHITGLFTAAALLGALCQPVPVKAEAAPSVVYEPELWANDKEAPRVYHVGACTKDKALVEVRFDLMVSPAFDQERLGLPSSPRALAFKSAVDGRVYGSIMRSWRIAVADMKLADITEGAQNPLRPLLNELYGYVDAEYNNSADKAQYVLPVLKGGRYSAQHPSCVS